MDWYNLTLEQWLRTTLSSWMTLPLVFSETIPIDRANYFYCRVPDGVYRNIQWQWFCPKLGCNYGYKNGAYVSAITICNQQ